MKFRPCIDLHHGQVKQIVGSTLTDDVATTTTTTTSTTSAGSLNTNFATDRPASEYAEMYKRDGLVGGHVIMLGPGNEEAAKSALKTYPKGLQVGGGINDTNAKEWLDAGASHVIVTSHVFSNNGEIHMERLVRLVEICGKEQLVLDLSCRKDPSRQNKKNNTSNNTDNNNDNDNNNNDDNDPDDAYYVVTNRWQTFTEYKVTPESLKELAQYCDEFLVHGVDVEGKQCGILEDLVSLLGEHSPIPVTYAGGIRSLDDMELVKRLGNNNVDATIGSALDCFGGQLKYNDVVAWHKQQQQQQQQQQQ
ncbi:1-5-phosphoribosyl-5-[5-phosphoribosylaminomethylideneamino] imidazole-4-carboxamide isomerase HisA [Nitzschia inconspicua]|uniref:1-5-phosphoribosyl-5-[5-phosphoribosylaminomethylideneamino] imidazole-4-carboxamide isomerase HisA n=1 Tax=Nitzschia inconspicua TaxID=303405 RepID=A0A9K3PWQ2_9STRA|nr:1-5-phosphoribosyl-5-[5-phosphoribosylaminomethylideneamino] imidazole-4-carboxamide isomerase HisA [Nitzschia inconspicua]KAG7362488.1 1-5-phosphoribosyl-5-[5-phosphoribosylaminomethylideneamino] imidazole-4-carboxamide isomerase HisA [Nitzschia inconspicua]